MAGGTQKSIYSISNRRYFALSEDELRFSQLHSARSAHKTIPGSTPLSQNVVSETIWERLNAKVSKRCV